LPVLEKYIFTLLNGAINFVRPQGYLFGWASATFFEKKNSFKIGLTVYASVPLRWFTQVCPCVKRKVFFAFFLKIACTFALRTQKRKEPEKISRSYGLRRCAPALVYASVPLREKKSFFLLFFFENCLYFCFTNTKKEKNQKKKISVLRFTQVCPCVKIEIACSFALHVGKKKGPRKIYFSLGVDCHPRTT